MQEIIKETFRQELEKHHIILATDTIDRLGLFMDQLLIANQTVNLTSITDEHEAVFKHLYDALLITNILQFRESRKILDIGSGAGIPAIPLAIVYPDKMVYSLEATQKKVSFQQSIKENLHLDNFIPLWNRAEVLGQDPNYRDQFDLVTARAVAATNILTELMIPFTKVNSHIILYKGKDAAAEIQLSTNALAMLHSEVTTVYSSALPFEYGERNLIVIQKKATSPQQFPRKPGTPQKKPLN